MARDLDCASDILLICRAAYSGALKVDGTLFATATYAAPTLTTFRLLSSPKNDSRLPLAAIVPRFYLGGAGISAKPARNLRQRAT
jgi:hypothetical protein